MVRCIYKPKEQKTRIKDLRMKCEEIARMIADTEIIYAIYNNLHYTASKLTE